MTALQSYEGQREHYSAIRKRLLTGTSKPKRVITEVAETAPEPEAEKAPLVVVAGWSEARVSMAAVMWARGYKAYEICEELGVTKGALSGLMARRQDIFPGRRSKRGSFEYEPPAVNRIKKNRLSDDIPQAVRRSATGTKVTVRRLEFLDGPAKKLEGADT